MYKKIVSFITTIFIVYSANAQTLKIGFVGPQIGNLSEYGIVQMRAIQDAIESANVPFEIELIVEDDQCDPGTAPAKAKTLVRSSVNFVVGHVCSGATIGALPVYAENNVLCITASATNPSINSEGQYNNFFRTVPSDLNQGKEMVRFLKQNEIDTLLLVFERNTYSQSVIQSVQYYADLENISMEYCQYSADESALYFQQGKNVAEMVSAIDAVIYAGYYPEFPKVYDILRSNLQYGGLIIGSDGIKDDRLFEDFSFEYKNSYVVALPDMDLPYADELMQLYVDKYSEEAGPNYLNAYTAALIMIQIYKLHPELLDLPKVDQLNSLIKILVSEKFSTPLGEVTFGKNGDIDGYGFRMFQMTRNGYEIVEE